MKMIALLSALVMAGCVQNMTEDQAKDIAVNQVCSLLQKRKQACREIPQPEITIHEGGKRLFDFLITKSPEYRIAAIVHPGGRTELSQFDATKQMN